MVKDLIDVEKIIAGIEDAGLRESTRLMATGFLKFQTGEATNISAKNTLNYAKTLSSKAIAKLKGKPQIL